MTESEKTASQNETGTKRWLKSLNAAYPPDEIPPESEVFQRSQRIAKMTDKETEIKEIAGTIFELKEAYSRLGMMRASNSYEERKKDFEEIELIKYKIAVAEKKLEAATL